MDENNKEIQYISDKQVEGLNEINSLIESYRNKIIDISEQLNNITNATEQISFAITDNTENTLNINSKVENIQNSSMEIVDVFNHSLSNIKELSIYIDQFKTE